MGDHVMQLAGQAQALLGHRPAGQLLSCPFQFSRPLLQLGGIDLAVTDKVTQHPGNSQDPHEEQKRTPLEHGRGEPDGRQAELRDHQAGQRDPPAAVGGHRIDATGMAGPRKDGGMNKAANASPLATQRASTAPGNRRRATSGKVCSNTRA